MSEIGKALAKTGHTDIAFHAKAYREAEDAYQKHLKAFSVRNARILLAKEAGDEEMVKQIEADAPPVGEFSRLFNARKDHAVALCEALSIDPTHLQRALA